MSFCRITGRSRGLPKPNYFPLLAPISPADAKRCCRITGKSYGLPSHHYIPVLLTSRSSKTKCKITNVAGELGPHHYQPEINYGNRKHDVLPDFRYVFPVLDGSTEAQKALMEMLLTKQVETEDKRYVYTVQERRCSLVFSAQMEAAVRDGDVRDVMLAKDSDTVLIKTKQGRSVSMDFKDFSEDMEIFEGEGPNAEVLVQREREELEEKKKKRKRAANLSSMKKIFETKEKLAEVEELEEEKLRQDKLSKKAKLDVTKHEKHDTKTFTANSFDVSHMRSKSSISMCTGDWKDHVHPMIESWDWEAFEKETTDEHIVPKVTKLPTPVKITPYHCDAQIYEASRSIGDVSIALENVPCVNPLKPIKTKPTEEVLNAVKELTQERLTETSDITEKLREENKIGMLPTLENLSEVVKNISKGKRAKVAKISGLSLDINKAKKFIPGHHVNTPQGPIFVPGQTVQTPGGPMFVPGLSVNTPDGSALIPGHIVTNENTNEPFFLAGQVMQTPHGEEFVCGQTIKTKEDTYRFTEGQTVISEEGLKFVAGKIINNRPDELFVPGQTIMTPEGAKFMPGQTMTERNEIIFTPGQNAKINNDWQFVPGQVVHQDNDLHFVPGATIATPNGLKFVPGQTVAINGETCFIPGITKTTSSDKLEFVPGATVDTIDGPKFIEGQIVQTEVGEKFMPGKTVVQADGHVEFNVAKSVEDITFSEGTGMGLPIDVRTCSVSEESLYVFGHMIQTSKGIEFYPGPKAPKIEGKVVPGRLVKNEANESRFVPGTMVEGIFVPGQIVYTENGEQFVPGQVVDTKDGPKFVPGQVVNTKSGPKFVPGQTIHTIDGPRFVPGQIIETKAGPTFIPGQVISTEDEGSRFVPGQVVDTEEGPRFVPGRVIETDDNGVTFVPGQIVQTPEGLKFVAPDLTEGEEGLEFSVQSFVVTPEELKLLKVKTNPNDTTSTKGELTIDTKMLRQLSEAGMSIGRQVPADLPAISVVLNETKNAEALKAFITDFGLKDDVANQLMEVIKSIIEMSAHLKSEMHEIKSNSTKSECSVVESKKLRNGKKRMEAQDHPGFTGGNGKTAHHEHVKNSIAAAVLAAMVTAEQFEEINNKNGKQKYQLILKSIDTILGKAIDEDFVSAMYQILQKEDDKETLCETILENSSQPKLELIKMAVNSSLYKHSFTEEDIIEKFSNFLTTENHILGPAFKNIATSDNNLLHNVLSHISDSISFIKTDNEATDTLQKAIVTAVQENSAKELDLIIQNSDNKDLKELIIQSVGLAKVLGMWDVADNLLKVVNDEESLSKIATDTTSLNILRRLTVMRKLADKKPNMQSALQKLGKNTDLARTDPNLRDLVRESAALMIVPEDSPLMTSADVPLSLLDPANSLAMEDFLIKNKRHYGALLIIKRGFQAVVPREASRAVLTGQIAYTVLDENGIRHFEPMHVFSALNLTQPRAHGFSMYSCPVVDNTDENLENFNGYCNISNSQIITKLGGWNRRYSGVILERENTRSRLGSVDYTPSYRRRFPSRSSTRSRSSCSRSPSKVEDVVVASSDYTATTDDEVSLKAGDIVEVLDTKTALGSKAPARDRTLDVKVELLDTAAAKHKIAVRPKKKHPKTQKRVTSGDRWLVRVVEDVDGGELQTRQGWVPARVLESVRSAEQDHTALAARRQAVVRELIETEEEFGRDMEQVVNQYMKPMDKATTPKTVFDNRELLFSNFRQIAEFHKTALLEGIRYYASEPRTLGRALLRMEREFDKHVAYCRDEPRAQYLLANDPAVHKYFQGLADKLGDDKGLTEHLKLPIQRINDYQLLLKELVKYSKRLGEDYSDLQKALELFLGVPNRATDNKFIASIEGFRGNIYKLGRLLTHDWFTVTESDGRPKERYIFLFKARILVCKVKRVAEDRSVFVLKDIIKLPEVEVKDHTEEPLKFSLIHKRTGQSLKLAAHKESVKKAWLTEIRQYASDVVALAEHAADDLQVLPPLPITSLEPEEKKKRALEDDQKSQEKRTKVEQVKEETAASKRKASTESAVATKVSRSEVSEAQVKSEVATDLETKSTATTKTAQSSQQTTVEKATESKVEQTSVEAAIQSVRKSSIVEQSSSSVQQSTKSEVSSVSAQSVQKSSAVAQSEVASVEQKTEQVSAVEKKSTEQAKVEETKTLIEDKSQESLQATSVAHKTEKSSAESVTKVEAAKTQTKEAVSIEQKSAKQQDKVQETTTLVEDKSQTSLQATSVAQKTEESSEKSVTKVEAAETETKQVYSIEQKTSKQQDKVEETKVSTEDKSVNATSEVQKTVEAAAKTEAAKTETKEAASVEQNTEKASSVAVANKTEGTKFVEQISVANKTEASAVRSVQDSTSAKSETSVKPESTPTKTESTVKSSEKVETSTTKAEPTSVKVEEASLKAKSSSVKAEASSITVEATSFKTETSSVKAETSSTKSGTKSRISSSAEVKAPSVATADTQSEATTVEENKDSISATKLATLQQKAADSTQVLTREESLLLLKASRKSSLGKTATQTSESKVEEQSIEKCLEGWLELTPDKTKREEVAKKLSLKTSVTLEASDVELQIEKRVESSVRVEEASASGESKDTVVESSQAVTEGEDVDEMSRYSRTSRLSGDFSSTRSARSYETSGYDGSGLSSYPRRESASLLSSSRKDSGAALDGLGLTTSRYESKYSTSGKTDGGAALEGSATSRYESKYSSGKTDGGSALEASAASRYESKYSTSGKYETGSKYDSSSALEGSAASKYESKYSTGKIDGAPTALEGSKYESKYSTSGKTDGGSALEGSTTSRYESKYSTGKTDGGLTLEGSVTSKYESKYSTSEKVEGGSKYGTESSIESSYEGGSKRDSIASKYGIETNSDTTSKIDSIASKYGIKTDTANTDAPSKLDEIASKYGIGVESKIESRRSSSKYEIENGGSSKIESSYSSKNESSTGIKTDTTNTDTPSKLDEIASKYGIGVESKIESRRSSKYEIENGGASKIESSYSSKNDSSTDIKTDTANTDTPSKLDEIASKYGIGVESKIESRRSSSKYESESGGASKIESSFSSKNESSTESKYSKSMANGSVTEAYESSKSVTSSSSQDGKPIFTKTLQGQNIEPGENATFECSLQDSSNTKLTWLKDNKPLNDRLMDRVNIASKSDGYNTLQIMHCREDDSGLYTARAENVKGNSHCTAQLVVTEMTAEERRIKNALNAPYFLVALKDTEILLNTYLRFMVKVKGNPNPDVTFYREGKEITSSESDRISIVRTLADRGCYELVIADVTRQDAGKYSCKASNIYGDVESEARVTVVDDKNIFFELAPGGEGLLAKGEKPTFTWKRDGEPFNPEERFKVLLGDDEDSLALVFQHVKPEDAGLYTCVAKTSTGNISCSAELTVQGAVHELHREPEKPKLVIEHKESIVSAGASAMLELQCKGYPKPNVVFKHQGKVVETDSRHKILYEDNESMSLVIKNVTSSDAGEYHVSASNDLGEDSTTINLVVKAAPKIKRKIENQSCMLGITHYVTIEVEGAPAPQVSFYKDGVEIKSSERIQIVKESEEIYKLIIKDAKLSDSGSYSVVAKNEVNQCSDFWQTQVTAPPKITKKLGGEKVCNEKETVTLKIEAEAEPAPTVKWFKNKQELEESSFVKITSSGSAHSLVISSAERSDAGEYSCEVRNVHGSASDSCIVNVRSGPKFTQKLHDITAKEGDVNVEFTVAVEAYPEPTVKWYLGDVEVAEKKSVFTRVDNGNTHKLILKEVSAEYSGRYTCKVYNELGEDSCDATFTVNRKPRITKSLVDMTVEAGQTLKLDVEVEGSPEPKVKWFKDGKEVSLDARIKISRDSHRLENYHLTVTLVKEEDGGEYEVIAENEMGSVSSKSTVTVTTKEVHSRFTKESIAEMEIEEDSKSKKQILAEEIDSVKKKADKGKTEAEKAEEKSFWDDDEDGKAKKADIEEVEVKKPSKARKSITEPEVAEEKSIWDDDEDGKVKKSNVKDSEPPKPTKGRKSITEPESAEEKSFWDEDKDSKVKKVTEEDVEPSKPMKARKSITEPETAEEKSFWDDDKDSKVKKVTEEDVEPSKPMKARKSITEPESVEEKSFWDDDKDSKVKKVTEEDVEPSKPMKARKSITEPESAEEKSFWDDDKDSKVKKVTEDVEPSKPTKARKSITEPETAEEKSFWDDDKDGKAKKKQVADMDAPTRNKAKKSITEPEVAERKSFWDDVDDDEQSKKPKIKEVETPTTETGEKSFTKPEAAEEKDFWDENHNEKKKPIIEEFDEEVQTPKKSKTKAEIIEEVPIDDDIKTPKHKSFRKESVAEEPLSAGTEDRVFQTVTTFKTGADGSIISSKVSSTRAHGAIITGPAETRTLHKMTSTFVSYGDDERKVIPPNAPHKTSLEVEEIASHSYFVTEKGQYTVPDHLRRGTYGIIEEPESETDNSSRCSRQYSNISNRAVSVSMSEDDTWQNESLSREISIEDLSKSIFDIDDSKKVFSKDSYVRQTSFIEDFFTDDGEEESHIMKEKSQKVYENDITERIIHISKEFDENDFKTAKTKIDDVKNRLVKEFVLGPMENIDKITKDITETTFDKKKRSLSKLCSVEEEPDDIIEELLRRSQRQRSILDDIITQEDEKAPPTIKDSSMKDSHIYESLPLVYTINAVGNPKPIVKWLCNGKEVKQNARVHISSDGGLHKLAIDSVEMDDQGTWACEVRNDQGKTVQTAELTVTSVSEFRKPIFTTPLEAQRVLQREPVTLKAVCTADPVPHVSWLLDGELLIPDATIVADTQVNDIEHGLKECTFSLHIPTGRHSDTGVYTIRAKNQYGVGESSARLDILLRPEIEGFKDVTAAPYEETTFVANIRANPIAEVKWSKDGYAIQPSPQVDIVSDDATGRYALTIKKVGVADAGVYKVTATNEIGEASHQAKLSVHVSEPVFTKPLQKQTVKDYDDCTLKVRCDGVPKPQVLWYRDGEEITNDDRHTVTTEVGGQVDSQLDIQHFNAGDAGKYKVRAVSLSGEAVCEAPISLAQSTPGFSQRLDRQRDVDEGEPLELRCKVDGSPMPTAKWYKDGVEIPRDDPHVIQTVLPDGTIKLNIDCVTPDDCGAYKLIISNPNGDSSALCAVAVNPTPRKPTILQGLEDTTAVVGQPLRLEAKLMAFPAPEIKWFKDGLPIRPSQAINFINQPGGIIGLSIDSCKPEDAGVYSLTVTNRLGDVASKANVDVTQKERKPAFIAELQPTKVIEGFPVKLEVKVLGYPQPTIKWTHNGKEIVPDGTHIKLVSSPDGTHALLIDRATAADAGEYGVTAVNDKGETGCKADLEVASRSDDSSPQERPRFIHGLRDVTAEEGQPLSVSAPFVGNPIPEVEWFKDGKPLTPSEKVVLTCDGKRVGLEISSAEMPDAGVYSVKLTNPLGEDSTDGKITVRKVYQPPRFTQKFSDLQQLPTFDANFPARVSGVPSPDITWYKNGQPLRPSDKYNIKRDGDACCLYVRNLTLDDAGVYKCIAKNREGEAACEANLEVVDKIGKRQKMEPPSFLKRIGDIEVLRGMSAKFTACATGTPDPDVEWYRNDERLFPCERVRMDKESTGLLRLTISPVDPSDVGVYRCRIHNPHGEDACTANLTYDTLEPQREKRPISDQYSDFDKMKKTGIPMPLADRPIISRMADRHLTLSWKPSIPHGPRFPVTYQVEMCELPDGDWFTARTGLRSCVSDIRNLEPFRDYKFRIRVENKYGVSDPSPFAITHRSKLEPDPPKFIPYLAPGIDFRPETSPYFPKDFDIERPPHDGYAQAPRFLRQEHDSQYGVKGHNVNLFWFVYGYPKPKMTYFFNDEPIEIGGRYDWSYTRNGQATLFINKMMDRDVGWYEAVATNEHGQARQRVRLEIAEYPTFIRRPEETVVLQRRQARMEARVIGVPYPEIKWYKDWQPITSSARIKIQFIEPDTTVLTINDAILKDEGLYSVSARNVAGAVSSSAMLHVEECERDYADRVREHPPRVKPSTKPFGDSYDLGDELGRGVQGVVYHAAERLTGRNYAAKIMHGHSELKPFMKNELDIMNLLNDRHLVRLHDAYEHDHTLALVTELASGGELVRDRLLRSQGYSEREIAGYIRQLLRGLKYMHDNSVAHLGLTIGELLLSHAGSDDLKLCDFGLSRKIQFNKHAALDYGMPEFVAPEVANGEGVTFAADMWSTGIITYILLSGHSPFRGHNDRETLTKIQQGDWKWHDEEWWSRLSTESRDFISRLLKRSWLERMDVDAALAHPWLSLADKIYQDEYQITTDRLRNYYNLYRDWTSNAQCRNWFRRRPLSGAFEHPSKMVYPPGEIYTPEGTPDRGGGGDRVPSPWDLKFKQWEHPDWEVSAKSESHYQNGPDTYLLQLRDTQFPVRLREYMKVACGRSPAYYIRNNEVYDPRTPIIHERRRFTDIMDEEIEDEQKERINNYGSESYTIRRLRHELGTRLDSYAEAEAIMEAKRDGQLPFLREKPQTLPIREGEPAHLTCYAVGDPKPAVQWFKNDMVIAEGQRIKIIEDEEGRSTLKLDPAMHHDIGFYKVVARNKVGQTVARCRILEATFPDAPDSPTAADVSDTEVLLRWKQPKNDGNSPIVCYSLQYKAGDSVEWKDVATNIDHEFFVVRNLQPDTSYQFRLSSRNRIGWSDKGIPTHLVKTKEAGAPKIEVSKAMRHLQQLTESGQEVVLDEERPKLDYNLESNPIDWDTTSTFTDRYSFISELWRGKFSLVVKGVDKTNDSVVVAKILENRPETEVQIQREFDCLRRLKHERISNLLAAYQVPGQPIAALVMEKLQGADILTYLSSRHEYTEQMVATIVSQILDGLQYLHWRGYCHLDLQPDNVVMASVRSIQVKIIDLGSAHRVTKLGTSVPQVGDLEYKAPEIINDEPAYPQTDVWSVGVLTYIMLSGVSPFRGSDDAETKQNISFVRYRFEHLFKEITQEATRFLMFVFKKVPQKRPSAEECHEHRWLAASDFIQRRRERAVMLGSRLKEFSDAYHERKAREASAADTAGAAFGSARRLARSNSVQEELLTTFAGH